MFLSLSLGLNDIYMHHVFITIVFALGDPAWDS